jgi:hypothetical protein
VQSSDGRPTPSCARRVVPNLVSHSQTVAIVIGADDPIAISYLTPIASWNSGFYLFSVPPNEADDHESELVCLDCLLDDPSLGRGLDIAREYGVADLDEDGEWVARRFPHCAR